MEAPAVCYFFLFLSLFLACCSAADDRSFTDSIGKHCAGDTSNDDTSDDDTSDFKANVNQALNEIIKHTVYSSFANATVGDQDKPVYAMAQCRGDITRKDCLECLRSARKEIVNDCQYSTDARIWFDGCFLRYGTTNFIGTLDTEPYVHYQGRTDATWSGFSKIRYDLFMKNIAAQMVKPWNKGLGKASYQLDDFTSLYAVAQCNEDLTTDSSANLCLQALTAAIQEFHDYCGNADGCRVVSSSCYVRYETYPFFGIFKGKNSNNTEKALNQSSP